MGRKSGNLHRVCGIYRITNRVTDECYVGLAQDISSRWKAHFQSLRWGSHHAARFQASYNEHGAEAFDFAVLEQCPRADLPRRERYWIDRLRPALNQNTLSLYSPKTKSDVEAVLTQRASAKTVAARKKIASESGVPSTCVHCEEPVTGKVVCEQCGEWLEHACEDCHNEVAHAVIRNHNMHFCGSSRRTSLNSVDADLDAYR